MLKGKKILLGITGSIAAYKAVLLVRLFVKEGAEVQVILTPSAHDFVTPLTLSTLSKRPVLTEPFDLGTGAWNSHIDLANWADLILIAPLTANTLSKMVSGQADNLLIAVYLAARCPVMFAPAMDVDMYEHPSTQRNIDALRSYGNLFIQPDEGELASGLHGKGRIQEPEAILELVAEYFKKKSPLRNKTVLVTAGPTYEKIDPVRFIGNFSSGRMGFALAEALAEKGAIVKLIAGPVDLTTTDPSIERTNITSAEEMFRACQEIAPQSDIIIMAAAVADFTPAVVSASKIKKKGEGLSISLKPSKDILAWMGSEKKKSQFLVGFALETDHEIPNAQKKLKEKNLDLIVLNSLKDKGAGFGFSTNKVTLIGKNKDPLQFPLKSKHEVAIDIVRYIENHFKRTNDK
ncbi:MAG: bifunctional phosphopantothenoylcysteine decarboxylase/phosphopantothenate--cysteine ligase CoaBC [Bacteroidota bacterium]